MRGGACILGSATPPIPRERSSRAPPILGVLLYLCLHPLTQNDQIWQGNTYGEGQVFGRSATPLCLHKCVARFVSDNWVSCPTKARINSSNHQCHTISPGCPEGPRKRIVSIFFGLDFSLEPFILHFSFKPKLNLNTKFWFSQCSDQCYFS